MAKFNRHDFVKFTEQVQRCLHRKPNTMLVMGFEEKEGKTTYELFDMYSFETYAEQEEEWLEGAPSPTCQMTSLPTSGLTVHDSENQTIGKGLSTVSVLGTTYTIETRKVSEDKYMKEKHLSGYCCEESKRIVIADMSEKEYFELDEAEQKSYYKKTLRHELLHAFLNESGLSDDASVPAGAWAKHEEMVDWFAIQSPKIFETFKELNIL